LVYRTAGYTAIVRGVAATITVTLVACVGPARDFATYEAKATESAAAVLSTVQTARLSVLTSSRRGGFAPFISVLLTEAEEDAGSVQATFGSIQPPDARSDALKERLDGLLQRALTSLTKLRVAARRGDPDRLTQLATPLRNVTRDLERFVTEHS
jgi:hypothetical protein